MGAFGDAVSAVGRMVLGLDTSIEKFIGSAGKFLGGLIEGAANALVQPSVDKGLLDLSEGLIRALDGVLPHLPKIADTFGNFLGLLGDLTGTLLPTAAGVLAELMPTVDSLISTIRDSGVLETLGDAVIDIAESLGPALADFAEAVGPVLVDALVGLAEALVDIAPVLTALIDTLGEWIAALGDWSESNGEFFDAVRKFLGHDVVGSKGLKELGKLGDFMPKDDGNPFTVEVKFDFERYWNDSKLTTSEKARGIAKVFMDEYERVLATEGQGAADALVESFRNIEGIPPEVIAKINEQLQAGFALPDLSATEISKLDTVVEKVRDAFKKGGAKGAQQMWEELLATPTAYPLTDNVRKWAESEFKDFGFVLPDPTFGPSAEDSVKAEATRISDRIKDAFKTGSKSKAWMSEFWSVDVQTRNEIMDQLGDLADDARDALDINREGRTGGGGGFSRQLAQGIAAGMPELDASMKSMKDSIFRSMEGSESWLTADGTAISGGLKQGIDGGVPPINTTLAGLGGVFRTAMSGSGSWLYPTGLSTMAGMQSGAVAGRAGVVGAFSGLRAQIAGTLAGAGGWFFGVGLQIANGIASGIGAGSGGIARMARASIQKAMSEARAEAEIRSPSRRSAREIGLPWAQGIGVGISKGIDGIRKSASAAVDLSGITASSPSGIGGGGDTFEFHGVTTRTAATEISTEIEKTKRRRVNRTGALSAAGVK
jgi:hypothetical protein